MAKFFPDPREETAMSAAGAPSILFRFSDDACSAELDGISLVAKLLPGGNVAVLAHTFEHRVLADLVLKPVQDRGTALSLMNVGAALIWSNWRRKHAGNPASKFRPTTADTVATDLRAFAAWLEREPEATRRDAASELNEQLDQWRAYDAFGTEGQCDPRGDHRD